jgi:hypothetical protein
MKKNSFIKVWISPRDVCLLATIRGGRPPLECAQTGNGPADHILAGLNRKQIQTLWNLGGCRDEKTGGPLLGPDGRLVCTFHGIKVPPPDSDVKWIPEVPKGPRSQIHYDELLTTYTNKTDTTIKAETARKLVNIHDMIGKKIKFFDLWLTCIKNIHTEVEETKNRCIAEAENVEREMISKIKNGETVDLSTYRDKIRKISFNVNNKIMKLISTIKSCSEHKINKEPQYYHEESIQDKQLKASEVQHVW